jgi:DMSO reductase anchor subunit
LPRYVVFAHAVYQISPVPDWSNVKTSTWFLTHTANFGMTLFFVLALQLPFLKISESMGNHDSKIVDADSVD